MVTVAHLHGTGEAPTLTASQRALSETVVASGKVFSAKARIAATERGRVSRIPVRAGQRVAPGEVLVELDDGEARAAVTQATAQLARARARVARLRSHDARMAEAQLQRAESELATAQADQRRTTTLVENGASARTQQDLADAALMRAREQRDTASLRLANALPSGGDGRLATAALLEARARLNAARLRLDQTRITAPAAGTIVQRDVEVGDVADAGRTLMVVAVDGAVLLSIQPDERALGVARVGQNARASCEAFPGQDFAAHVDWIAPAVDDGHGTVEIRLLVPSPPEYLRPDMTVSVTIDVGAARQALIVPAEVVHELAGSGPYVLVRSDGRDERRLVRLGRRSAGDVEVVAGIAVGDQILRPPTVARSKQKIHPWD